MTTKHDHSTQKDLPEATQPISYTIGANAAASTSHIDARNKPKLPHPEEITMFQGCESKQRSGTLKKYAPPDESLNRPEPRSLIGSYAQKTIPFRSASFSQVDYTSGKYIRSALGALKASLIKAKSPPPIAENKRSRSSSPETNKPSECTNIWIPLKGPCERRNDRHFDTIDAAAMSNIILEEENETSPTVCSPNSLVFTALEENPLKLSVLNVGEMTTDSPQDESLTIQNVENLFQDASNTLIPVPVFERSCNNTDNLHLADEWLNACEIDSEQIIAELVSVSEMSKSNELPVFSVIRGDEMLAEAKFARIANARDRQSPTLDVNEMPAIAVTPGSSISGSSFEEAETAPPRHQSAGEYVVRKRNSAGDKHAENRNSDGTHSASTSGANSPKSHHDEKRRIDKSKRRKGVYIQWAALDKHNNELSSVSWTPADSHQLADGSGQSMWAVCPYQNEENAREEGMRKESHDGLSLIAYADDGKKCTEKNANDTEPCTPESDCGRQQLIWQRQESTKGRRQSLTLQSSEEKDESPSTSSPPASKPPSKLFVLRSDSCSDNELSDKSPSSRDRASQSPAPDQDLKRYSKRPLRGPYGQMLEAEMKKPAKQNYDGLLEELNRSER